MTLGDQGEQFRFLICDRDTKFMASLDAAFTDASVCVLRSPSRAAKVDAYARAVGQDDPTGAPLTGC